MARYLTPPKINLLVLTSLYCEGAVSSEGTIPILSFIVSQLFTSSPPSDHSVQAQLQSHKLSVDDFEIVTIAHSSTHPGRTVFDLMLKKLWSINSFHALHEFFENLSDLLARSKEQIEQDNELGVTLPANAIFLSRTSPLGAFVRRAQLEFTRLQFHDALKLWIALLKYKEPTASVWQRRNPAVVPFSFDTNIDDLGLGSDNELLAVAYGRLDDPIESDEVISTDDMERILAFQAEKLQRLGLRMPHKMKENLREMIGPATTVPSLSHFVKFFDAWRGGDFTSAFDNLHRYFDYTMQSRDKTFYQYALLHMAILQTDFGCLNEAISALNETIATARENQDISCLNFSLGWLNHLNQAFPQQMRSIGEGGLNGSERDALNFLKTKAKENKMYSLLSSALLSEARLDLSYGERSITKAFQHVYQASHINIRENILGGFGSQLLMHSAVFERLGVEHLASAYCDIILKCYHTHIPTEDNLRALCRIAFTAAKLGQYNVALQFLEDITPTVQRTLKFHQMVIGYLGLVKLLRAIRRSDAAASEHMLQQLRTGFSYNADLRGVISQLSIQFHMRLGSLPKAFELIEDFASGSREEAGEIYQRLYLLVLKARLFAKAGEPQKGFSIAMRAASTAHRFQVFPLFWEAIGCLANILNHLQEFDRAQSLLDAIIPQALEGGDTELCALLYLLQADTQMGLAGKNHGPSSTQRALCLSRAELYVDRAGECFKRIEDVNGECEVLMKKSIIASGRGDLDLANDWAARYLAVQHAWKNKMQLELE